MQPTCENNVKDKPTPNPLSTSSQTEKRTSSEEQSTKRYLTFDERKLLLSEFKESCGYEWAWPKPHRICLAWEKCLAEEARENGAPLGLKEIREKRIDVAGDLAIDAPIEIQRAYLEKLRKHSYDHYLACVRDNPFCKVIDQKESAQPFERQALKTFIELRNSLHQARSYGQVVEGLTGNLHIGSGLASGRLSGLSTQIGALLDALNKIYNEPKFQRHLENVNQMRVGGRRKWLASKLVYLEREIKSEIQIAERHAKKRKKPFDPPTFELFGDDKATISKPLRFEPKLAAVISLLSSNEMTGSCRTLRDNVLRERESMKKAMTACRREIAQRELQY